VRRYGDDGFTLTELLVSLIIVAIVMTALLTFFVSTTSILSQQRDRQAAIQLAGSAMELVRAKGTTVTTGRVAGSAPYVAPGVDLSTTTQLNGISGTPVLPLQTAQGPIAGVTYQRYIYVGTCNEPATGTGAVGCTTAAGPVRLVRVVVAITWSDRHCTGGTCSYVTATLVSCGMWTSADPCAASEPVFQVIP
jgi:prepilin-type N-terminal cleavage/methylation domain-containing protein